MLFDDCWDENAHQLQRVLLCQHRKVIYRFGFWCDGVSYAIEASGNEQRASTAAGLQERSGIRFAPHVIHNQEHSFALKQSRESLSRFAECWDTQQIICSERASPGGNNREEVGLLIERSPKDAVRKNLHNVSVATDHADQRSFANAGPAAHDSDTIPGLFAAESQALFDFEQIILAADKDESRKRRGNTWQCGKYAFPHQPISRFAQFDLHLIMIASDHDGLLNVSFDGDIAAAGFKNDLAFEQSALHKETVFGAGSLGNQTFEGGSYCIWFHYPLFS